jgi:hypothetical protein
VVRLSSASSTKTLNTLALTFHRGRGLFMLVSLSIDSGRVGSSRAYRRPRNQNDFDLCPRRSSRCSRKLLNSRREPRLKEYIAECVLARNAQS